MTTNTRKLIVMAEFEYEAEILDGDPEEPWAFADLQQNIVRSELINYLPGVLTNYPVKVSVYPDRKN